MRRMHCMAHRQRPRRMAVGLARLSVWWMMWKSVSAEVVLHSGIDLSSNTILQRLSSCLPAFFSKPHVCIAFLNRSGLAPIP